MGNLLATAVLVIILLSILATIVWSVMGFYKDWPIITRAWKQMESFEKRLLPMGLLLFILIPALKDHAAADTYIPRVLIEILPGLAGSFFVAGVLSYMKQVHDIKSGNRTDT